MIGITTTLIDNFTAERRGAAGDLRFTLPQRNRHPQLIAQLAIHLNFCLQYSAAEIIIKASGNMEIADLCGRFMQQRDVTENAAHPPHILIFQITAVTPAQHHHREAVFSGA